MRATQLAPLCTVGDATLYEQRNLQLRTGDVTLRKIVIVTTRLLYGKCVVRILQKCGKSDLDVLSPGVLTHCCTRDELPLSNTALHLQFQYQDLGFHAVATLERAL